MSAGVPPATSRRPGRGGGPRPAAEIRLAGLGEAARIARISRDHVEYGLPWTWTPSRVQACVRHAERVVLAGTRHGRVVGFAIMRFGRTEAHLDLLAVLPRYRRRGLATRLLRWLEDSARTAGMTRIRLELRASNEDARACYVTLGYRETARVARYYGGSEAAIRMVRDLAARPADGRGDRPWRWLPATSSWQP